VLANRYVGIVSVFLGSCTNVNAQEFFTVLSLEICLFIKLAFPYGTTSSKREKWV